MPVAIPSVASMVPFAAASSGGNYVHWGVINIGVTNLVIIAAMIVVFVLAIVIPFPHARKQEDDSDRDQQ